MQELANDIMTIGAALSGLLLVFIGSIVSAYEGYQADEQSAVRPKLLKRAWLAFSSLCLALIATLFSFVQNYYKCDEMLHYASGFLILSFVGVFLAALLEVKGIK